MRYLIQNIFKNELSARKKYIYDTMSLWSVVSPHPSGLIHLTSFPPNCLDILFIVGHNIIVRDYLLVPEHIPEKVIVAITCDRLVDFSRIQLPGKTLYLPKQNQQKCADLLLGSDYGFEFNLTESEILFYRTPKHMDVLHRLDLSFEKVLSH